MSGCCNIALAMLFYHIMSVYKIDNVVVYLKEKCFKNINVNVGQLSLHESNFLLSSILGNGSVDCSLLGCDL